MKQKGNKINRRKSAQAMQTLKMKSKSSQNIPIPARTAHWGTQIYGNKFSRQLNFHIHPFSRVKITFPGDCQIPMLRFSIIREMVNDRIFILAKAVQLLLLNFLTKSLLGLCQIKQLCSELVLFNFSIFICNELICVDNFKKCKYDR